MSGFESNNNGDWDGGNEMAWNEFDWQQYLKRNEKEILRFLHLYLQSRHQENHMDQIASLMDWDDDDWSLAGDEDEAEDALEAEKRAAEEVRPEDLEPYTIHRHPVYIVTNGLYRHLRACWEKFSMTHPQKLTPTKTTQFVTTLHAGETNALMAINSLDVGDYSLAVCHLKNALSALNHSLGILQRMQIHSVPFTLFQHEAQGVLFDLRDVWLRVMRDCREEARNLRDGE